jgi:hypothetical protein
MAYSLIVGWWLGAYMCSVRKIPLKTAILVMVGNFFVIISSAFAGWGWFHIYLSADDLGECTRIGILESAVMASPIFFHASVSWLIRKMGRVD